MLSNNLGFTGVARGTYTFTTLQPRYLNVPASLGKTVEITAERLLSSLALKGGNAVWSDNIINIQDASLVGGQYKQTHF